MSLKPLSSFTASLTGKQVEQLQQFASELSPIQLAWLGGYFTATAELKDLSAVTQIATPTDIPSITILYGSQTGNSRGIATELAAKVEADGYKVNLFSMGDYKPRQIKQETILLAIVSTHGEGEAPDDALELHQFLASKRAPELNNLHFSVLALGDSSYELFCQTGKEFDERLAKLGAKRLQDVVLCDVDYAATAEAWQTQILQDIKPLVTAATGTVQSHSSTQPSSNYSKQNAYMAEVLVSQKITGRESDRDIRHVEIDLADSGIEYQAGDALGVWFTNSDSLVDELLAALSLDGAEQVELQGESLTLKQALKEKLELTQLYPALIENWAKLSGSSELDKIAQDKASCREFILANQLADLVRDFAVNITAVQLVELLRPLTPRLYSIASSQDEVESEVHLTVALVEEKHQGVTRFGGASQFLAQAQEGDAIKVYVEPNNHFRLPQDPQTPVIMIGPGTGIAPFRAFMQQRSLQENSGDSWLFFGNPHIEQDFLYQTEWQQYLKSGALTHLDLAFSRDQSHKVYVQHKLLEQGEKVWQWISSGAHLYLCGDAERMAKDVHQALVEIISQYGEMNSEQAEEYISVLRREKRFQKDVY